VTLPLVASALAKPTVNSLLICLALAAVVLAAFYPALGNGFTGYDDGEYVVDNVHVRTGVSGENVAWAFRAAHSNNWHPLTWISHALDATMFGLNPTGHHLTSLLLHIGNTVLLFLWLSGATGRKGCSAFVALGFGLHPVHVESVAWVAERKDVLSTFFWLLALLAYTAYTKKPGLVRNLLVAALLAAGLMSKQMLVTLPLLLLLLDWWPLGRRENFRWLMLEKMPLLALSALACAVALWAQRAGGAVAGLDQLPLKLRLPNAALAYLRYLAKTAWPVELSVLYPFPLGGIAAWKVVTALAALAGISAMVFVLRTSRPWLAAGWAWYVITLLPVIGIVQVGMQAMADRYLYVPMIGLLIAMAWECAERWGDRRALPVLAAVWLLALGVLAWRQVHVWKDGVTLFEHAVAVTSDNFIAHNNLGVELDRRGRSEEALVQYRETLRLRPGDHNGTRNFAMASFAKGERLFAQAKYDEGMAVLQEGLQYQRQNALAHTYIGLILTAQGKPAAAVPALETALGIDPSLARAHMGLAVALEALGRGVEARREFAETIRLDASSVEAYYDLGLIMARMGEDRAALGEFDAAIRLKPDFGPAHVARAYTLYALGMFAEAGRAVQAARAAKAEVNSAFAAELARRLGR